MTDRTVKLAFGICLAVICAITAEYFLDRSILTAQLEQCQHMDKCYTACLNGCEQRVTRECAFDCWRQCNG